jgi:hypothetical protein
VIGWFELGLVPLARETLAHPKVSITRGDVLARLMAPPPEPAARRWHAVLLDVDHAPEDVLDPRHRAFYADAGLRRARGHLAEHGVLAVWSNAPSPSFARNLEHVFREVRVESVEWFNALVDQEETDVLFLARR